MDDELTKTAVLPHLSTRWLGQNYHFYDTITSTNDILKEWVNQGDASQPPAGTVLVADYQSAGRGRMSRRWEAERGTSLMFSLLLRPNWPAQQLTWLTMIASLAVVEAAEHLVSVPLGVKWPNDVMLSLDGSWRKWGGLLLEGSVGEDGRLQTAILGIGLNVNMTAVQLPEGLTPVSSLSLAAGHRLSRRRLLVDILASLERHYEAAAAGDSPQTRWRERLITLGQAVTVHQAGQAALQGQAVDVDAWGQLLVQTRDGRMHTIAAGDVSLRG
ncbi:MAG: biotin--[acetyl-CoA-carboxylase] ligase [Ardenticatenaceae bacterium]|nr:biotin--[acetyl-CoA-carboxylase] ligase [Ardenticatenaceae bacterium]